VCVVGGWVIGVHFICRQNIYLPNMTHNQSCLVEGLLHPVNDENTFMVNITL
jgi:hypothetical protein